MFILKISLLCFVLILQSHYTSCTPEEARLLSDLFRNYSKNIVPRKTLNDTLLLKIDYSLISLKDIAERYGEITFVAWIKMFWNDYRLKWNPSDYGNVEVLRIPSDFIWLPDILAYNDLNSEPLFKSNINSVIKYSGDITYVPPVETTVNCQLDITSFPYDTNKCYIKFGSWTYDYSIIKMNSSCESGKNCPSILREIDNTNEFKVTKAKFIDQRTKYDCCKELYQSFEIIFTLKRNYKHNELCYITTTIVASLLTFLQLVVPVDSKRKCTIGGFILLSSLIIMICNNIIIPNTAVSIPNISRYVSIITILNAIHYGFSLLTLYFYYTGKQGKEPGNIVNNLINGFLGRLLLVTFNKNDNEYVEINNSTEKNGYKKNKCHKSREYKRAWINAARVMDRLFLLLFIVVTIVLFVSFMILNK